MFQFYTGRVRFWTGFSTKRSVDLAGVVDGVDGGRRLHKLVVLSTLSPLNELSSAKCLVCLNFQIASMSLEFGENVVRVSNSSDPGETTDGLIRIQAVCIWHYSCA